MADRTHIFDGGWDSFAVAIMERRWLSIQQALKDLRTAGVESELLMTRFDVDEGRQQPFLSYVYAHWCGVLERSYRDRILAELPSLYVTINVRGVWNVVASYLAFPDMRDIPFAWAYWPSVATLMRLQSYRHPESLKLMLPEWVFPKVFCCVRCGLAAHAGFAPYFASESHEILGCAIHRHHLCAPCAADHLIPTPHQSQPPMLCRARPTHTHSDDVSHPSV